MAVPVESAGGFKPGIARQLFDMPARSQNFFTVGSDGKFYDLEVPASGQTSSLWLVQNWIEEVKQKLK
ncbi:MAG: hypothetical protein JST93_01160 [Acidobacteria bacterium]|nr:hypothetical protein [Acidobacteriota bacterium]